MRRTKQPEVPSYRKIAMVLLFMLAGIVYDLSRSK